MTVSLIGRICTACCPVFSAHEIKVFKSPKSPVPQLPFERSETTGIAVPAMRCAGRLKNTSVSAGQYASPRWSGCICHKRFGRVSHSSTAPVFSLIATNLYSKGDFKVDASSVSCHTLGDTSFIRIGRQYSQLPKALQLPIIPSTLPSA